MVYTQEEKEAVFTFTFDFTRDWFASHHVEGDYRVDPGDSNHVFQPSQRVSKHTLMSQQPSQRVSSGRDL